ncbi:class I SAM-dependent methyltransferase [Candidatus Pelagibacter sp.]|nr:class I SAM-dependent methyltransferase [Candidatus Pelagibacter sp.]
MVKLKKKLKYKLDSYCKHKYILARVYTSKPKSEISYKLNRKYKRKYYKCLICDHHISDHNYDLTSLYSGNYVSSTYGNYEGLKIKFQKISKLNPLKSDNFHRCLRINFFFKDIKKTFKTLDIGAGLGIFPKRLKSKKFNDISLIETDDINVNFLKNFLDFKKTFKNQSNLKNTKFDLITLNKVLEHIDNPSLFLKKYLNNLKNNGYIYIEVPDLDAKEDKIGYNREEFSIEHHHVFSKISLILMLTKLNLKILKIEKIREPSTKYTLFCFAQKIN